MFPTKQFRYDGKFFSCGFDRPGYWVSAIEMSCKIVNNYRIIGLNRARKNKFCSRFLYDKKGTQARYCFPQYLCTKTLIKSTYLKDWFTHHLICSQDLLVKLTCRSQIFLETQKIPPDFFHFGLLFRQRNASLNWLQPRTIVCCIKLCFGDVQLL